MLKKEFRLHKNYQFERVKKYGQTAQGRFFLLNYLRNNTETSRFGFVVTKRLGNAPARHRAKRVLRAVIRFELNNLKKGYDVVVVVRNTKVTALNFNLTKKELRPLLRRAGLLTKEAKQHEFYLEQLN